MLSTEVLATLVGGLADSKGPSPKDLGFFFYSDITRQLGDLELHREITHIDEHLMPSSNQYTFP